MPPNQADAAQIPTRISQIHEKKQINLIAYDRHQTLKHGCVYEHLGQMKLDVASPNNPDT